MTLGAVASWRWAGDRFVPDMADAAPAPDIIDSWLVEDGAVRGLDRHVARFAASVGAGGPDPSDLLPAVAALLPRQGRWFPRLEAASLATGGHTGGDSVRLRVRPAPPQGGPLAVAIAADARRRPRVKGPDLDLLADVHAGGVAVGADEVLLVDGDGAVREGTRTALLWWEGDELRHVDAAEPVLPSVTASLLVDAAREAGIEVRAAAPTLTDLDGRETWLVNALHGVRPVRAWVGVDATPGPTERAAAWQAVWQGMGRDATAPLPGSGPRA